MNRKLNTEKTDTGDVEKHPQSFGFSLFELLVSMTLLSVLLAILLGALAAVSNLYVNNDDTTRAEEKGRAIIELITREVTPAVIDTRMQFVILPADKLADVGALDVVEDSPAMLWMAPLGPGGELRCVGYYLTANDALKHYRLKRIFVQNYDSDDPNQLNPYFPNLVNQEDARDITNRTSPVNAGWFTRNWTEKAFDDVTPNNTEAIISTVSDGIVAFWIQALDSQGNPVPRMSLSTVHPQSDLHFNSAGYFYMADETAFDDGSTFAYLKQNRLTMKANRLPTALELAIVMISDDNINNSETIPPQENILDSTGALDLDSSIEQYTKTLESAGFNAPRVFRTKVKLTNGG